MRSDQLSFSTICFATMPGPGPAVVPHPLEELVPAVAAAGFTRIGLDWFTLRDAERRGVRTDLGGLAPAELCALGLGEDPAADGRVARSMARRCGELGIPVCVLSCAVPPSDPLRERIAAVADVFAAAGTRVGVEFVPYSGVRTLAEARSLGVPVVIDSLHLLRSGSRLTGAVDVAGVQWADGPADAPADLAAESREARLLPGQGAVDFAGLAAGLDALGYTGPVTVEVLSASLRTLPPAELARRAWAACRPYVSG